jgi:hypothetical protein
MRTIKFRGKLVEEKTWEYGYYKFVEEKHWIEDE